MAGRRERAGATQRQRERGRRVAAWIRSGMIDPRTGEPIRNAVLARRIKKAASTVGVWLNDCWDESEERVKLPSEDAIEAIAGALGLRVEEGLAARFYDPNVPARGEHVLVEHRAPYLTASPLDSLDPAALRSLEAFLQAAQPGMVRVPRINGRVAVRAPLFSAENVAEYLAIPAHWAPRGQEARCFALTVEGNAMEGADIRDGDVLAVRLAESAEDGQLVAALIGEEVIVRRLRQPDGGAYLVTDPEERLPPVSLAEGRIVGVPIGSLRQLG